MVLLGGEKSFTLLPRSLSSLLCPHGLGSLGAYSTRRLGGCSPSRTLSGATTHQVANDIYYGERKLAGILVGHSFSEMRINYSIVGVGLNVNERAFPSDLPNPISLYQIVGKELDLSLVRSLLYQSMEQRLGEIATLAPTLNMYHLDYLERLYKRDEQATFRNTQDGREFMGIIRDVQPNGLLVMMVEDGLKHFAFKEIEYVHDL